MVRAEPGANLWLTGPGIRAGTTVLAAPGRRIGTADRDGGHAVAGLLAPTLRRGSVVRALGVRWTPAVPAIVIGRSAVVPNEMFA